MTDTQKKFYVYVHKYASGPKKGQVFYVGKGQGRRYLSKKGRNTHWERGIMHLILGLLSLKM